MTKSRKDELLSGDAYKPGYDGDRVSDRMSGPERQAFRLARQALVGRLHDAVLTISFAERLPSLGVGTGSPAYLAEFGDRVGEEAQLALPSRFEPNAAQVSDAPAALALLEGLRPHFFKILFLRALHEFAKVNGERGLWSWDRIGERFGLSGAWAEAAHDTAIVQAARRAGLLPTTTADYAVVMAAAWANHGWLTNLSTAADPRQAVANLRAKSPVRIEQAMALWVSGPPVAKRITDAIRHARRGLITHASWYKLHPDVLSESLVETARDIGATWMIEDIAVRSALEAA